jgi:adenylate cyclase
MSMRRILAVLAAAAFVAIFAFGVPFPLIVIGAGLAGVLAHRETNVVAPTQAPVSTADVMHTVRTAIVWLMIWLLPVTALLIALGLVAARGARKTRALSERLERAALELQRLQMAFSRFAPDHVIERIIADGSEGIGEKKEVTVLFADLVGFTALSESVEPVLLVRILNGYFERMSAAITEHHGYISTFIGDGILALFGAMAPNPWQGNDAAEAALAMREALAAYNEELAAEGLPSLSIGIGLHRGTGVAGVVGSAELKEFAFIGRTVNVAARAQDLTRSFAADIILTDSVRQGLDRRFVLSALPETAVKGVERPLSIFALEGCGG